MKKIMIMVAMFCAGVTIELQAPRSKEDRKSRKDAHEKLGNNLEAWRNSTKDALNARRDLQNSVQPKSNQI